MTEDLMSWDPKTGLRVKRDPQEKLTRLEWYTELMEAWVYQKEIADKKAHMAVFKDAAHGLKHAIWVLEHSYSTHELYGVTTDAESFYDKETKDAIAHKRIVAGSVGPSAVPDATGDSGREDEDPVSH